MAKHTERLHALALLLLFLLASSAIHAQCRSMGGMSSEKINLPYGLCKKVPNCDDRCNCCTLPKGLEMKCWDNMDDCKATCGISPPSVDVTAEARTLSRSALPSN